MITHDEIDRMSSDEKAAWIESLTDDEKLICDAPVGWRYTLVLAAVTKNTLQHEIPDGYRLEFLEHLRKMEDGRITAAVLAVVEPFCDEAMKVYAEVRKVGARAALDMSARWEVFNVFVALNPSLREAIRMMAGQRGMN